MDIFIIHGEYSAKSYERLQQYLDKAKKKNWQVVPIDKGFSEAVRTPDLFGQKKLFLVKDIKLVDKKLIAKIDGNLLLYRAGEFTPAQLKAIEPIKKIENFRLPKTIFNFLDTFYPGNSTNCLTLLHQIIDTEPIEFIFSLLGKTLRDLYWVKIDPGSINYAPWRVEKLKRQANKFSEAQLKDLIGDLADIDIKAKTSVCSLLDSLDLLIIQKLQ